MRPKWTETIPENRGVPVRCGDRKGTTGQPRDSFVADEGGATAIEYALIAASVALVIIGGTIAIGTQLNQIFVSVATHV